MNDEKNLHYHWDGFNRLRRVTDAAEATVAAYVYDSDGRRPMKDLPGTAGDVSFTLDGWQVIEQYEGGAATPKRQFVYGAFINEPPFMDVDINDDGYVLDLACEPEARYHYHQSPIYSVVALTDYWTQTLVERYDYDPYGQFTQIAPDGTRTVEGESAVGNLMTFTGHWFDRETGMYYMRKRFYNDVLGSFINRDIAKDGLNLLIYAHDNPIALLDAYGLASTTPTPNPTPTQNKEITWIVRGRKLSYDMRTRTYLNLSYKYHGLLVVSPKQECVLAYFAHIKFKPENAMPAIPYLPWMKAHSTIYNVFQINSDSCTCKGGVKVIFTVLFGSNNKLSSQVNLHTSWGAEEISDHLNWNMNDTRLTMAPYKGVLHEIGHHFGLPDDYSGDNTDQQFIDNSIMGNINTQGPNYFMKEHLKTILHDSRPGDHAGKVGLTLTGEIGPMTPFR